MIELRAGRARATIDPVAGGRLTTLRVGRADLLTDEGCFVMAPWAGRTGDGRFVFEGEEHALPVYRQFAPHAIHGTVRDRPWSVESVTSDRVALATELGPDWPWPGRCEQEVALTEDAITLRLALHADDQPFPAVMGWHPWFRKPSAVALAAGAMLERGDDHLPTGLRVPPVRPGKRPLDDCFEDAAWPVRLRRGRRTITVEADRCRYVVVYDEPTHATCVEPQTGPPNGLATGEWSVVAPGQPLAASTTWSWRT